MFTEEHYQKIVSLWNMRIGREKSTTNILDYLNNGFFLYDHGFPIDEALAIANPLTREWAHDKFVEKEKKYVWQSKNKNSVGRVKRLYNTADGISDSFNDKDDSLHNGNLITETEVKKWGYNPEMFDKEEV